jgi:hypothetical protein
MNFRQIRMQPIIQGNLNTRLQGYDISGSAYKLILGQLKGKIMTSFIPLPNMTRLPGAKVHPYPFKIGLQATKLIQGSVFYSAFVDVAVGEFARAHPDDAYQRVENVFFKKGMSKESIDLSWKCLQDFKSLFPDPVFQYSLFSMVIHWDWFISKMGCFVNFARLHDNNPPISKKQTNNLQKLGMEKTDDQLLLLEAATGLKFKFENAKYDDFKEMLLVRNLGMHNEWEIDQFYMDRTKTTGWKLGQLRTFASPDLYKWQEALLNISQELVLEIAKRYVAVPDYM